MFLVTLEDKEHNSPPFDSVGKILFPLREESFFERGLLDKKANRRHKSCIPYQDDRKSPSSVSIQQLKIHIVNTLYVQIFLQGSIMITQQLNVIFWLNEQHFPDESLCQFCHLRSKNQIVCACQKCPNEGVPTSIHMI